MGRRMRFFSLKSLLGRRQANDFPDRLAAQEGVLELSPAGSFASSAGQCGKASTRTVLRQAWQHRAEHLGEHYWRVTLQDGRTTLVVTATRWRLITILPKGWQPRSSDPLLARVEASQLHLSRQVRWPPPSTPPRHTIRRAESPPSPRTLTGPPDSRARARRRLWRRCTSPDPARRAPIACVAPAQGRSRRRP